MLLYDILLYKHVFDNVDLYMPYASHEVRCLVFSVIFYLSSADTACTIMTFTLVPFFNSFF